MIDLRDVDPALIAKALSFGSMVKASLSVAADACVDVGAEEGMPAQIMRSTIAAEALMLAAAVLLPVDAEEFAERARWALALAEQRRKLFGDPHDH